MNPSAADSRTITLLGVPSSAGARLEGQEQAPRALRQAGLLDSLRELGVPFRDRGDLPQLVSRPDPVSPRQRNAELVLEAVRGVADALRREDRAASLPVLLGGDCTITLGAVSALLEPDSSLGLLYVDGDLDLNTPQTTPSGIFDGMVTAHLLGRGHAELARCGPRHPLLEESQIVYFGYDTDSGAIDPPELTALERSASPRFPVAAVREDPLGAARQALTALESRADRILVHFDVDVTNLPAVDVAHPNGLPLDRVAEPLKLFLASPKCVGLVVTEFNPRLDADGSQARRLARQLGEILHAAHARPGADRARAGVA